MLEIAISGEIISPQNATHKLYFISLEDQTLIHKHCPRKGASIGFRYRVTDLVY